MPKLQEYCAKKGYEEFTPQGQHKESSWLETMRAAKNLLEIEPTTLPNTYLKYYLMADETVKHTNLNYTRANEIMDRREKDTFEECERIVKKGTAKDTWFDASEHSQFIVELACALAFNTQERFLLIVPNNGAIQNFADDAMVEIPCLVGKDMVEPMSIGKIPTFQKGLMEQQVASEKLAVEAWIDKSYQKLWQSFTMNKTVPSAKVAKEILDEMIVANKDIIELLKDRQYVLLVCILFLLYSMVVANNCTVIDKMIDLNATNSQISLKWSLQSLLEIPTYLAGSYLLRKYSSLNLLKLSAIMITVQFLLFALASDSNIIIILCVFQVFSTPLILITSKTLIFEISPKKLRSSSQLIALSIFMGGGASLIIPTIAGFLSINIGYNYTLMVLSLFGCLAYSLILCLKKQNFAMKKL